MPSRSFKVMFVEVLSFLTLFALMGSISSNFWERYLIQSELSKMKTSLHILKATVLNIGTTYDNLHRDLIELAKKKEKISYNSYIKDISSQFDHKSSIKSNKGEIELSRRKANKNQGNTAFIEASHSPMTYDVRFGVNNATTVTLNPLKSTAINSDREATNMNQNNKSKNGAHLSNDVHTQIHKCCKNNRCFKYASNKK